MEQPEPNVNPTVALRRTHRWRMALSGLVILMAGITLGVAGTLIVVKPERPRPPDVDHMVAMTVMRFRDELGLTNEQVNRIRTVLKEHFGQLEALRIAARPKIEQVLEDMKTQVSAVLTKEQQSKWERLIDQLEKEFQRGMRRRPRGPGGPGGPGRPGDGPRGEGRGDWPRGRDRGRFGPGDEGRPWGPRPEGADPNWGHRMRRPRPDTNDMSPLPMEEGQMPPDRPPEPNGTP